jgi:phospholipid/cholesterol/gamma-HCH transport system substrate-binding protein
MLTLGTRLKNIAFLLIALLVMGYIGARYADLGRYVGLSGYYVVKADLPETGGLFPNSDVTYRGVSVGKVGAIRLTGTDGVQADLHINDSAPKIPSSLRAEVAFRSAVGEEYINLLPTTSGGPYLADGKEIPLDSTQVPAPVTTLLTNLNNLATSVPLDSLRVVVDEFGNAFTGQGENLQVLLDTGSAFLKSADAAAPQTNQLIVDGKTVLQTQNAETNALLSFGNSAKLLAAQFAHSDTDLRRLIAAGPGAATQLTGLLRDLDPNLSVLLANLLTTSEVAITRVKGTKEFLIRAPQVVAAGSTTITPRGATFGQELTFFTPLPCTQGYGGTVYRNGLDTSPGPGLNTAARCASPASSGIDVRGSANAPSGGAVPDPAQPGSLVSAASLPGALALPSLPAAGPANMSQLLGLYG